MELQVNGLGTEPNFVELPDGEYAGFELDSLRIFAKKVQAKLKFTKFNFWFDYERDENGVEVKDEMGNFLIRGTHAEIFYKRATFGIAEHFYMHTMSDLIDYLIHSTQTFYYRAAIPRALPPRWNLLRPFARDSWIAVGIILPFLMITYGLFIKFYGHVHNENNHKSWLENAILIYMHQLSQGELSMYIHIWNLKFCF